MESVKEIQGGLLYIFFEFIVGRYTRYTFSPTHTVTHTQKGMNERPNKYKFIDDIVNYDDS